VAIFFLSYLALGLFIIQDYGASWDEIPQRELGILAWRYVFKNIDYFSFSFNNKFYGTTFQLAACLIENILKTKITRDALLIRHYMTFLLFFAGTVVFFFLCKLRFKDRRTALFGAFSLIICPQIFSHSFYNPKDIPFLSLFIIGTYTMLVFLKHKTYLTAILHATVSAVLVSTRILGIMIPFFTFCFLILDIAILRPDKKTLIHKALSLFVYFFYFIPLLVLIWPVLWNDPLHGLTQSLLTAKDIPFESGTLFLGEFRQPDTIPWFYTPLWMIISNIEIYVFLFFAGILAWIRSILSGGLKNNYIEKRTDVIFALCFFVPLIAPMIARTPLFDSWRHHFFIFPFALIFVILGIRYCSGFLLNRFGKKGPLFLYCAIALNIAFVVLFMIRNHPFQHLYFNSFIGGIKGAYGKFELDYWGLSYKQGYKYILDHDNDYVAGVAIANYSGRVNAYYLPFDERARIYLFNYPVEEPGTFEYFNAYLNRNVTDKIKYFATNYRWDLFEKYPYEKFHSIEVDGVEIFTIYKLYAF